MIPGANFRERERLKRLAQRWRQKLEARSPAERQYLREVLLEVPVPSCTEDPTVWGWLETFPVPPETAEARQARIFKGLMYDMQLAIDEFGYEAVYFGVGCEVFPDAVDPWSGLDHF